MIRKFLGIPVVRWILKMLMLVGVLVIVLPKRYLFASATADYANQILFLYFLLAFVFLIFRQPRMMFFAFAGAGVLSLFLKYSSNPEISAPPVEKDFPVVNIAQFNLSNMESVDRALGIIDSCEADVISLQEVTPLWDSLLRMTLKENYPFQFIHVDMGIDGMAVFSKFPLKSVDTLRYHQTVSIMGRIDMDTLGNQLCFIGFHPKPPLNQLLRNQLVEQLDWIAGICDTVRCPLVTFGDYNLTPWSDEIQNFRRKAVLNDSRRGSLLGIPTNKESFFFVPSEHIFYSNQLNCTGLQEIKNKNSMYLGVVAGFQRKVEMMTDSL